MKKQTSTTDIKILASIINKALQNHVADGIKGDAIAAASVFDDEATLVMGSEVITGREAIDAAEANQLKEVKMIEAKHNIEGLSVQGDYAYQLGEVKGKMKIIADGSEIEFSNKYMASWRNLKNGVWKIHYFIYYP